MSTPNLDETVPVPGNHEDEANQIPIPAEPTPDQSTQPTLVRPPSQEDAPLPTPAALEPAPGEMTQPTLVATPAGPGEASQNTQPTLVSAPPQPPAPGAEVPPPPASGAEIYIPPKGPSWVLLAVVGIITLIIIAVMSAVGGYRSGMFQRQSANSTLAFSSLKEQYDLGVKDMEARQYSMARQRFEWIIQQDPNYPGVIDKLAESQYQMGITASPTIAPTPTLTPTPDLRSVDEMYTNAQQLMLNGEWDNAIDTLLKLRKRAPDYHPVDIDGMLWMALRNRGVDKIKTSDLEEGIYDLAQAERFGPLDTEAKNYRDWAEFYITGASFWEVDWVQAINYFSQLATIAPGITDSSGWTAVERLRRAYVGYGDQLALAGDWCGAQKQYENAAQVGETPGLQPTAANAAEKCATGGGKKGKKTPTTTPEGGSPGGGEVTPAPAQQDTPTPYP